MGNWWKKQQQAEETNARVDGGHPNKRFDALDEALGGVKETFAVFKLAFAESRAKLETLWNERDKNMADLAALTAAVAANTAAVTAATTAINGLVANGVDPSVIAGLTTQLQSNNTTLQNAVAAVTPATPPVVTPPAT